MLPDGTPFLDRALDPKSAWALRHMERFPVEVNRADYETLLRVPGIGVRSAKRIVASRRIAALSHEDLDRIGVVMKRARHFLTCGGRLGEGVVLRPDTIRERLGGARSPVGDASKAVQLELFAP